MNKRAIYALGCFCLWMSTSAALAMSDNNCPEDLQEADISFIEFPSLDLTKRPPAPLTVKGKLSMPAKCGESRYADPKQKSPAVVILHGSAGVDARGDFYARELNAAGIATLEIDMWEARGISGAQNRPQLPFINYPDAFGALSFMAKHPKIDSHRIGELGFSWGAVITMASA
ncbi:MAG: dienelactone hydrolase family protein, partial [Methylomonas sp.]